MGFLDKVFGKDDKGDEKRPPDFSDVRSGGSSTAPGARPAGERSLERERTYVVVAGDSLSKIATREYGEAGKWRAIYEANRDKISNPDLIHPGQVLTLPPNP